MTFQNRICIFLTGFSFGKLLITRILQHNSKKNILKGLNLGAKGCRGCMQCPCTVYKDHNLPSEVDAWRTDPDKHHIYGQIFCEGRRNNYSWLWQNLSSPVAHKLHDGSLAMQSLQSEVLQNLAFGLKDLCSFRSQHDPQLSLRRRVEGSN